MIFKNKAKDKYSSIIQEIPQEKLRVMPLKRKLRSRFQNPSDAYKMDSSSINENDKYQFEDNLSSANTNMVYEESIYKNNKITPIINNKNNISPEMKLNFCLGKEYRKKKYVYLKNPKRYYKYINQKVPMNVEEQILQSIKILQS